MVFVNPGEAVEGGLIYVADEFIERKFSFLSEKSSSQFCQNTAFQSLRNHAFCDWRLLGVSVAEWQPGLQCEAELSVSLLAAWDAGRAFRSSTSWIIFLYGNRASLRAFFSSGLRSDLGLVPIYMAGEFSP